LAGQETGGQNVFLLFLHRLFSVKVFRHAQQQGRFIQSFELSVQVRLQVLQAQWNVLVEEFAYFFVEMTDCDQPGDRDVVLFGSCDGFGENDVRTLHFFRF